MSLFCIMYLPKECLKNICVPDPGDLITGYITCLEYIMIYNYINFTITKGESYITIVLNLHLNYILHTKITYNFHKLL